MRKVIPRKLGEQNTWDLVSASWMTVGLPCTPTLSLAASFFWWFSLFGWQADLIFGWKRNQCRALFGVYYYQPKMMRERDKFLTFSVVRDSTIVAVCRNRNAFVPQRFWSRFSLGIKKKHSVFLAFSTIPVRIIFGSPHTHTHFWYFYFPPCYFSGIFMIFVIETLERDFGRIQQVHHHTSNPFTSAGHKEKKKTRKMAGNKMKKKVVKKGEAP